MPERPIMICKVVINQNVILKMIDICQIHICHEVLNIDQPGRRYRPEIILAIVVKQFKLPDLTGIEHILVKGQNIVPFKHIIVHVLFICQEIHINIRIEQPELPECVFKKRRQLCPGMKHHCIHECMLTKS